VVLRVSVPALERVGRLLWASAVVLASSLLLLWRLAPDVHGKPLFEDEAIVGQISTHGMRSVIRTVMWDRGGAPLHFVLAHVALDVSDTATALRWLSVVAAVATVPVAYDLGRRIDGPWIGAVAAVVCASSGLLEVVGSFGRMYALYALAGAVAADMFVRAAQNPTGPALALAAAAGVVLPATHPYGGILIAAEGAIALVAWRGRPPRAAIPAIAIAAASSVFLLSDLRLGRRFDVGGQGSRAVASPREALDQLEAALRGFAGGELALAAGFLALALVGLVWCAHHRRAFGALALSWLLAPVLLTLLARSPSVPSVKSEPRHLVSDLAAWAVLIALGSRSLSARLPQRAAAPALAAVALIAVVSPVDTRDVRTSVPFWAVVGQPAALAAPSRWIDEHASPGGVLYPYSVAYLRSLASTARSISLPRAEPSTIRAALDHGTYPARGLTVAIPIDGSAVSRRVLRARLGRTAAIGTFPDWLVIHEPGAIATRGATICRLERALAAAQAATSATADADHELSLYLKIDEAALVAANPRCERFGRLQ
jgi:hypothetical protein